MSTILPPTRDRQVPRPAICPTCGLAADNGIVVRSEAHLFSVTWIEVAG